jgi:hypothetical protein
VITRLWSNTPRLIPADQINRVMVTRGFRF